MVAIDFISTPLQILARLLAGAVLACALAACHGPKAPNPPPNIDGLTQVLNQAAGQKLQAPSLANEEIVVEAPPQQAEARAREIAEAASAAGGAGIESTQGGEISILADIPAQNAAAFTQALRDKSSVQGGASPQPGEMETIEVRIDTQAAASPAPASPSPTPP